MKQILILGGGYAGTLAAMRLAGRLKGEPVQITLVNGTADFVERIRLHQVAAGTRPMTRPLARWLAGTGVAFVQGWIERLDIVAKQVLLADGRALPYDYLIYALGSAPATEAIAGTAEHGHTLGTVSAAEALAQKLGETAELLIVGGGLTGIEAAAELAEQHPRWRITLATNGTLGDGLHPNGAAYLRRKFAQWGIILREETSISHLTTNEAHTTTGETIPFSACLVATSFVAPKLAKEAGLAVNEQGQAFINGHLQAVGHPEIYVVGDAAATGLRMACATAMPQGAYAADVLAAVVKGAAVPRPFRFGYVIRCISLGRKAGLVQVVDFNDVPQSHIVRGWFGAQIKELICRFTVWTITLEKWLTGSYRWPKGRNEVMDLPLYQLTHLSVNLIKQGG